MYVTAVIPIYAKKLKLKSSSIFLRDAILTKLL